MNAGTAAAIALAGGSTTLTNLAYLREHDAAAVLPTLSMRRPLHSVGLLLSSHGWLLGFGMESSGFCLYVAALALASLSLVQSIGAAGIAVLGFVSARLARRRLTRRELAGVTVAVIRLVCLGISLTRSSGEGGKGSLGAILLWIGSTIALALIVLAVGRRTRALAIAEGVAGGLFFSVGDFSTKLATQGGARLAFAVTVILGYTLGTSLLQLGYQRGKALTVAGLATLLTDALPILAGTIVLSEPVPSGTLGALRIVAFVAVVAGAILLAAPQRDAAAAEA